MLRKLFMSLTAIVGVLVTLMFLLFILGSGFELSGNKYTPEGRDTGMFVIGYLVIIGLIGYAYFELWKSGNKH